MLILACCVDRSVAGWDYGDKAYVGAARHLVTLRAEGLLGEVSACNFDTQRLRELVEHGIPVVSNQVQYSLLDRRPVCGVCPACVAHAQTCRRALRLCAAASPRARAG